MGAHTSHISALLGASKFQQEGGESRQVHGYMKLLQVSVAGLIFQNPQTAFKAQMCLSASVRLDFARLFSEGFEWALSLYCVMHVQ